LAGQGKPQSEIARTLGVSVMTLHRWRKIARIGEAPKERSGDVPKERIAPSGQEREEDCRIAELELENSRLRKLVTDLLLEKIRLEEEQKGQIPGRSR
jgi:putative transposase